MSQSAVRSNAVILTEAAVESLIFNAKMQAAAPYIRHAQRQWTELTKRNKGGCGTCKKRRPDPSGRKQLIDMVRQNILLAPPQVRDLVKDILRTKKVVVPTSGIGGPGKSREF